MSKQRAKGTGWEVELLPLLRTVWRNIDRAPPKGAHDRGDFTGIPGGLALEAKKTDAPHFQEWARKLESKVGTSSWRVLWSGDRRKGAGHGPYVMLPLGDWIELEHDAWRLQVLEFHGSL